MKQTAVQWFYEEIWRQFGFSCSSNILDKAKEIEKQQMIKIANYLRNNYQPLAPNQAEWQRIKDKKVLRIEDIIDELNKQD